MSTAIVGNSSTIHNSDIIANHFHSSNSSDIEGDIANLRANDTPSSSDDMDALKQVLEKYDPNSPNYDPNSKYDLGYCFLVLLLYSMAATEHANQLVAPYQKLEDAGKGLDAIEEGMKQLYDYSSSPDEDKEKGFSIADIINHPEEHKKDFPKLEKFHDLLKKYGDWTPGNDVKIALDTVKNKLSQFIHLTGKGDDLDKTFQTLEAYVTNSNPSNDEKSQAELSLQDIDKASSDAATAATSINQKTAAEIQAANTNVQTGYSTVTSTVAAYKQMNEAIGRNI